MTYYKEAQREEMDGIVILGSKVGYDGRKVFSSKDITKMLHDTNEERVSSGKETINCIITPSVLVGRATEHRYQEEVYNLQFSVSPRSPQVRKNNFFDLLQEYAIALGKKARQTRVYIKFDGKITILKRK